MENTQERLILLSKETKVTKERTSLKSWGKNWKKKSKGERVVLWIMLVIFIVYAISLLYPIFWAFISSFKTTDDYNHNLFGFPTVWTTQSYRDLIDLMSVQQTSLFESIWNSIWQSVLSTVLGIFASCLTAYVVAKYRFRGSGFIYAVAIFIQIIPLVGTTTGMWNLLYNTLGIANKPVLIWPIWFGGFGFSFLMIYSAFKSVSWSYAESAFIDGAGHFTTFFRIMLPTIKPVLASLFIVNFIAAWNEYMTAYLYLPDYPPLALTVYSLEDTVTRISMPTYFALIVISIIPTILLFVFFQRTIMENTTTGGLKG